MRPHYWLPETTSWGGRVICATCDQHCGRYDPERWDWICGGWRETEEEQINFMTMAGGEQNDDTV